MKHCVLNVNDTGACESTAYMLEAAGYKCLRPDNALLDLLRTANLENVLSSADLVRDWGYAEPNVPATATIKDMVDCDLFVDTKAHFNYTKIVKRWPNLEGKVLWCCLNGGDPTKRKEGEWAYPTCPVLTNNQWYRGCPACSDSGGGRQADGSYSCGCDDPSCSANQCKMCDSTGHRTDACTCYPPYMRKSQRTIKPPTGPPICLVHNVRNWGYGELVDTLSKMGVEFYGGNGCPDGLLPHDKAMERLSAALCMVHLKTGDTVGYAMVEAIYSGVPFVCTQFYIDECKLGEILEPGVTCLTFDPKNAEASLGVVLRASQNPEISRRYALAALERYEKLAWNVERDGKEFSEFMEKNFVKC